MCSAIFADAVSLSCFEKLADLVSPLARRESIERADVEAIVTSLQSPRFAAHVRNIPGYDASRTGEVSNVSDVTG
jgi:hypothetical protein